MSDLCEIFENDDSWDKMNLKTALFLILLLTLTSRTPVFAQSGILQGLVVDKVSQESLPAATVQVLGTTLGASTDVDGKFTIRDVPVGTYQVRVSLVGYEPIILDDIVVAVSRPAELLFKLHQTDIDWKGWKSSPATFRKIRTHR
jgi:hypothetical protein